MTALLAIPIANPSDYLLCLAFLAGIAAVWWIAEWFYREFCDLMSVFDCDREGIED